MVAVVLILFLCFGILDFAFANMRFERIRVSCSKRKLGDIDSKCTYIGCPNSGNCALFEIPERKPLFGKLKAHFQNEKAIPLIPEYRCVSCLNDFQCVKCGKQDYPCSSFSPYAVSGDNDEN